MQFQKTVNLLELESVLGLDDYLIKSYLRIHDCNYKFDSDTPQMKISELKSYLPLVKKLNETLDVSQLNNFALGFKLNNQVNTEFDLLRACEDTVVNIEIKSKIPNNKKIEKQAFEHYTLLNIKFENVHVITFVDSTNELFVFNPKYKKLEKKTFDEIRDLFPAGDDDLQKLENSRSSDFLISPYNDGNKFLKGLYILNGEQIDVRNKVLKGKSNNFVISGGAGTGKTLLLLDILKYYVKQGKKIAMILGVHPCEELKKISMELRFSVDFFYVVSDLNFKELLDNCDILFFDESQLMDRKMIETAIESSTTTIFSVDEVQIFHNEEMKRDIESFLKEKIDDSFFFRLKKSVRRNKELHSFEDRLLTGTSKNGLFDYYNVGINLFYNTDDAKKYIKDKCEREGFKCIEPNEYTDKISGYRTLFKFSENSVPSKSVIGQEFNKVIVIFTEIDSYNKNGELRFGSTIIRDYPYMIDKMLYEAITRACDYLDIVIIGNQTLYKKIQTILTLRRFREEAKNQTIKELEKQITQIKKENNELKRMLSSTKKFDSE